MGLTKDVGEFLAGMRFERVPERAVPIVVTGFTDCIGVMLAGLDEPVTSVVARGLGLAFDRDAFAAFAPGIKAGPDVALLYGTAAHALDYDDTALSGHPSAVLVPAIVAEALDTGADGRAMVAAYVAGYEVWADLIRRDADRHHQKGWHPSAVFGAIAAASASSVLRRLDADAASRAVGIAASLAGGVVANFGTMTKPFQVGRAAQSGLTATRLAQAGATAAPDALEHELGFLAAVSPRGQVDVKSPAALGETWRILESGVNIKQYPMCYGAHRVVDATIDLCRANKVAAADIANVDVELGEAQAVMLRNHRPQSGLDAKFSLEFAVAAAAISGRCTNAELSTEFVRRADVQDFFARVRSRTVAGRDPDDPAFGLADRVRMSLRDGRQLDSTPVHHPRGHFKRPLERDALWQKFSDCAVGVIGAERSRTLFEALGNLPVLASLSELGSVRSARDGAGRRASVR